MSFELKSRKQIAKATEADIGIIIVPRIPKALLRTGPAN
jgi:hypothetical protein